MICASILLGVFMRLCFEMYLVLDVFIYLDGYMCMIHASIGFD